jgi:aminoglycoside/choline kinase family phosphotransferase
MHTRQNELNNWLEGIFGNTPFNLTPLAGDASFRRYYRLHSGELSRVVMDAPPDKETITSFINISNRLAAIGIHTPAIIAVEHSQGFILLEDLGDELLLRALTQDNADKLYTAAISTLLHMQQCPTTQPQLPIFDKTFMLQELTLFREWFLQAYLSLQLNTSEILLLKETFDWLTTQIAMQPQVFIHRDYHSRNLIVIGQTNPLEIGVIDFQDAMHGPFTYDLVSLLKDCYIQWPREQVISWLTLFHQKLIPAHDWSFMAFTRGFDLCGLQRHLKVLGIFCRLHLRDNKEAYLRDLPLTFNYVNACLESYSELQPFYQFMQERVYLPFIEKNL